MRQRVFAVGGTFEYSNCRSLALLGMTRTIVNPDHRQLGFVLFCAQLLVSQDSSCLPNCGLKITRSSTIWR